MIIKYTEVYVATVIYDTHYSPREVNLNEEKSWNSDFGEFSWNVTNKSEIYTSKIVQKIIIPEQRVETVFTKMTIKIFNYD